MPHKTYRLLAFILFWLNGWLAPVQPIAATSAITFVITAPGAWVRVGPDFAAPNTIAVFKDEVYEVLERSADGEWLRLSGGKIQRGDAWLHVSLGVAKSGELKTVPITRQNFMGAPPASVPALPSYIPNFANFQAKIKLLQSSGRDPNKFTVVGDCNAEPNAYLGRVAAGLYQVPSDHPYLFASISRFGKSFSHWSIAAKGGFRASSLLDVSWADPAECRAGENPLTCELRRSNAGFAFIELGTGDQFLWKEFDKNYRTILDTTLRYGVLPIAVTKADNLEAQAGAPNHAINDTIRKLAAEYGVPLLDFWQAAQALPNGGLIDEGNADFHLSPAGSDLHLLVTLQTLAALRSSQPSVVSGQSPVVSSQSSVASSQITVTTQSGLGVFRVNVAAANLRNAPALTAPIVGRAQQGQELPMLAWDSAKTWARVALPTGGEGWIFAALGARKPNAPSVGTSAPPIPPIRPAPAPLDFASANPSSKTVPPMSPPTGATAFITITANAVNVRSSPSTQAAIVGSARAGQRYAIIARSPDGAWVQIAHPSANPAWVLAVLGRV